MPLGQQWQMTTSTPDLMPVSRVGPDILTYAQLDVSMTAAADQETSAVSYSPASIAVDRASPVPLYYQVAQELERAIESGELKPAPDAVAHEFGLPEGTPVLTLERIRFAQDEPLALLHNFIPTGLVELTAEALERTGLYQLMRAAGVRLHLASQTIGARAATAAEAAALQDRKGTCVLTMQRTAFDDTGRAVEYGSHLYRASY